MLDKVSNTARYFNENTGFAVKHTTYTEDAKESLGGNDHIKVDLNDDINVFYADIKDNKVHVYPSIDAYDKLQASCDTDLYSQEELINMYQETFAKTMELFGNNDFVIHSKNGGKKTHKIIQLAISKIEEKSLSENSALKCQFV